MGSNWHIDANIYMEVWYIYAGNSNSLNHKCLGTYLREYTVPYTLPPWNLKSYNCMHLWALVYVLLSFMFLYISNCSSYKSAFDILLGYAGTYTKSTLSCSVFEPRDMVQTTENHCTWSYVFDLESQSNIQISAMRHILWQRYGGTDELDYQIWRKIQNHSNRHWRHRVD